MRHKGTKNENIFMHGKLLYVNGSSVKKVTLDNRNMKNCNIGKQD